MRLEHVSDRIALAVTLIDVALALPLAFFMAKVASRRAQRVLLVMVLMPLWASYLVKAYAWRSVLSENGILAWLLSPVGGESPGYGVGATIITLAYLWLPYVILLIALPGIITVFTNVIARLRRMGTSFEEASADLGVGVWTTFTTGSEVTTLPIFIMNNMFRPVVLLR